MQRLIAYHLLALTADGREVTHPGPARVEVYTADDVEQLLGRISIRLTGHSFAMASDIHSLITKALSREGK